MSQTQPSLRDRFLGRTAAAREQFDVILDEDLAEAVDSAQSAVDTIESRITLLEQQRRDIEAVLDEIGMLERQCLSLLGHDAQGAEAVRQELQARVEAAT